MTKSEIDKFLNFINTKRELSIVPNLSKQKKEQMLKTPVLVISCSHFSIKEDEFKLLCELGLKDKFDTITLPGASLALGAKNPNLNKWKESVIEQIKILKNVHELEHIILFDHLNCAAYKNFYLDIDKKTEKDIHKKVMEEAKKLLEKEVDGVKIYRLLLGFDGKVENLENSSQ